MRRFVEDQLSLRNGSLIREMSALIDSHVPPVPSPLVDLNRIIDVDDDSDPESDTEDSWQHAIRAADEAWQAGDHDLSRALSSRAFTAQQVQRNAAAAQGRARALSGVFIARAPVEREVSARELTEGEFARELSADFDRAGEVIFPFVASLANPLPAGPPPP